MATYRQILDEVTRKPGEVWKTSAGTWAGKRGDKTQYGLADKDKAQAYVAGKDVHPIANGMATAADWMSAGSFLSMAGLIAFLGKDGSVYLM